MCFYVNSIPQAGGLGLKFFDGGNAPFTRKMKRRLMDTSDHYRKLTAELREKRLAAAADGAIIQLIVAVYL